MVYIGELGWVKCSELSLSHSLIEMNSTQCTFPCLTSGDFDLCRLWLNLHLNMSLPVRFYHVIELASKFWCYTFSRMLDYENFDGGSTETRTPELNQFCSSSRTHSLITQISTSTLCLFSWQSDWSGGSYGSRTHTYVKKQHLPMDPQQRQNHHANVTYLWRRGREAGRPVSYPIAYSWNARHRLGSVQPKHLDGRSPSPVGLFCKLRNGCSINSRARLSLFRKPGKYYIADKWQELFSLLPEIAAWSSWLIRPLWSHLRGVKIPAATKDDFQSTIWVRLYGINADLAFFPFFLLTVTVELCHPPKISGLGRHLF